MLNNNSEEKILLEDDYEEMCKTINDDVIASTKKEYWSRMNELEKKLILKSLEIENNLLVDSMPDKEFEGSEINNLKHGSSKMSNSTFNINNHKRNVFQKFIDYNSIPAVSPVTDIEFLINSLTSVNKKINDNKFFELYSEAFKYIYCWRSVNGDGNCFYRAVMFLVIERAILKNDLFYFRYLLTDVINAIQYISFKKLKSVYSDLFGNKYKNDEIQFLVGLMLIYEKMIFDNSKIEKDQPINSNTGIKNNQINQTVNDSFINQYSNPAYEVFLKLCIHNDDFGYFDVWLIIYLRFKIFRLVEEKHKYLYFNDSLEIGLTISDNYVAMEGSNPNFRDYFKEDLLKLNTFAEKCSIFLPSFIAKLNLYLINFDTTNLTSVEKVKAIAPTIKLNGKECDSIYVVYKNRNHYDVGYTKDFCFGQLQQFYQNSSQDSPKLVNTGKILKTALNLLQYKNKEVNTLMPDKTKLYSYVNEQKAMKTEKKRENTHKINADDFKDEFFFYFNCCKDSFRVNVKDFLKNSKTYKNDFSDLIKLCQQNKENFKLEYKSPNADAKSEQSDQNSEDCDTGDEKSQGDEDNDNIIKNTKKTNKNRELSIIFEKIGKLTRFSCLFPVKCFKCFLKETIKKHIEIIVNHRLKIINQTFNPQNNEVNDNVISTGKSNTKSSNTLDFDSKKIKEDIMEVHFDDVKVGFINAINKNEKDFVNLAEKAEAEEPDLTIVFKDILLSKLTTIIYNINKDFDLPKFLIEIINKIKSISCIECHKTFKKEDNVFCDNNKSFLSCSCFICSYECFQQYCENNQMETNSTNQKLDDLKIKYQCQCSKVLTIEDNQIIKFLLGFKKICMLCGSQVSKENVKQVTIDNEKNMTRGLKIKIKVINNNNKEVFEKIRISFPNFCHSLCFKCYTLSYVDVKLKPCKICNVTHSC